MSQTPDTLQVDVEGGRVAVHDLSGGPARHGAPVVLAAHGITANGLMWQPVADELVRRRGPGSVRFLAPDLRGRGASNSVDGPFGLAAHADDLLAVAAEVGDCPVLVGHSMGAFIAALTVATAPGSFRSAVLVDGGLAFPAPADLDIDAALQRVIGPAMERLGMRFESPDAYLAFWARHPGLGPSLEGREGDAVRAYILHDLVDAGGGQWRSACVLDAVRADGADVLADERTHRAVSEAVAHDVPVEFLWAHRGLLDEPQGLYDEGRLAALGVSPEVRVTAVDANHYTIVLEEKGVAAVADAIERQLDVVR
jgi:pimeloyl-ACP methyl ester carboxylesterase